MNEFRFCFVTISLHVSFTLVVSLIWEKCCACAEILRSPFNYHFVRAFHADIFHIDCHLCIPFLFLFSLPITQDGALLSVWERLWLEHIFVAGRHRQHNHHRRPLSSLNAHAYKRPIKKYNRIQSGKTYNTKINGKWVRFAEADGCRRWTQFPYMNYEYMCVVLYVSHRVNGWLEYI